MCDKEINIRVAMSSDCSEVYAWRSDPISVSMFCSASIPSYEEHKDWFNSSLNSAERTLYIGQMGSIKIGVCRFDRNSRRGSAEVSINMNPACRGKGLGKKFLELSIEHFRHANRDDLTAKIKPENEASLKIFKSCGFQEISSKENVIVLERCPKN